MGKRWNQKGSIHAQRRMAELRSRKLDLRKRELIGEWYAAHRIDRDNDRYPYAWRSAAQAAGLQPGCGTEAYIAFLERSIAEARRAA